MAIDLNNATFKLFTDFATQAKSLNTRALDDSAVAGQFMRV